MKPNEVSTLKGLRLLRSGHEIAWLDVIPF